MDAYEERMVQTFRELGISDSYWATRLASRHTECTDLVSIGLDLAGREQRMERRAAAQWQAMQATAKGEGVVLAAVSAFRSFDYQKQIIARKLAAGQSFEQIIRVSALPGFSEHHTGQAIDIGTPGCPVLTEAFEETSAYAWLVQRASEHGFRLSYPRGNERGVIFEPWHWCFKPA
jgi:zinc D-Ala-D-Ala carboxypeptidase